MFENIVIFIPSFLEAEKIFNITNFSKTGFFHTSSYKNIPVVITGVGKTNSSITSALFFSQYKPKYSLLTGICGAYEESGLHIGDIVSIKKDYLVDECSFNGKTITTLHEKGFLQDNEFGADFLYAEKFKAATSNTVSFIACQKDLVYEYMKKTNALVENMEGAAFGIAANKFNVMPYHIRSVSNFSTTVENQKWDIKKAAKNLKDAVDLFLNFYAL